MNLQIRPILSTLKRHRITCTLLILQIALTCAIVCNAVFLVRDRLDWMDTPSGVAEDQLVRMEVGDIGTRSDVHARTEADLTALRALPGVQAATVMNSLPFGDRSWNGGITLERNQRESSVNTGNFYGEGVGETLGLQLVAGRWFRPDEYAWMDDVVSARVKVAPALIVSMATAQKLFPEGHALGRRVFVGENEMRIVGVVARLSRAGHDDRATIGMTTIAPLRESPVWGAGFVLRVKPGEADRVLAAAVATLRKLDPRRVITEKQTYRQIRDEFFASDRAMAVLLVGVCVALLTVTALGIVGLASFWVGQRRRQIGVRRALGARRVDVLRYFQTENFLLTSIGIGIGMVMAYGINLLLMWQYEAPRLPAAYLPAGAVVLWLLGQVAVLAPAMRAAAVPPVVATRG
ncbi:FtsX-like permease family protein [Luteibacter sp. ME-Dv--P-043b]|uniref:ABC transporter permease n=1 Tax=Luteibacter sp. ME-Dv--P-043b TaxID=3040291 RepID=UPI0031F32A87